MKVCIVVGSHRIESESSRVASFIDQRLKVISAAETAVVSLAGNPLPLWDEGVWADDPKWQAVWTPIARHLAESDAIVVVSPEWSGMAPAGLKNFFLLCGNDVLAHKPGLIVAVSAALGGSYPVAELRMSSYKNTRLCYIPEHVIVRNVGRMLKGDSPADEHDAALRARIDYSLRLLIEYAKGLAAVRASGVVDLKQFPYGM